MDVLAAYRDAAKGTPLKESEASERRRASVAK
jgi:hypothetical protein